MIYFFLTILFGLISNTKSITHKAEIQGVDYIVIHIPPSDEINDS